MITDDEQVKIVTYTQNWRSPIHTTFQKIFTIIRIFLKSEAPKALYSSHSFIVSALKSTSLPSYSSSTKCGLCTLIFVRQLLLFEMTWLGPFRAFVKGLCPLLNAPRAFHYKRFNLEMNAGAFCSFKTPGAAYRENLGPT